MAITLKSTSTSLGTSITLPAGIVAGDVILLFVGSYSTAPNTPSGFTSITGSVGTGTYSDYGYLFYKVAAGTESGTSVSIGNVNTTYGGNIAAVLNGVTTTGTWFWGNSLGSGSSSMGTGSVTSTGTGRRLVFYTMMQDAGTVPTFSTPSGFTKSAEYLTTANGYHATALYLNDTVSQAAGAYASVVNNSNLFGGNVGIQVFLKEANPPTATSVNVSNDPVPSGAQVTGTWTYTSLDSKAQSAYQFRWRKVG